MKNLLLIILCCYTSFNSYCQYSQIESFQFEGQPKMNIKDHSEKNFLNDTLWVMDSSSFYKIIDNNPVRKYTYSVLSRNNLGNIITTIKNINKDYPENNTNTTFDSIVYFDGELIKQRFTNIWDEFSQSWLLERYRGYDLPDVLNEVIFKFYSQNSQQFVGGFHELISNSEDKPDTIVIQNYIASSQSWMNESKSVYHYNNYKNDTLIMIYRWKNDLWVDSAMHRQQFDSGNLTQKHEYILDSNNSTWLNFKLHYFSYNSNGLYDTIQQLFWNDIFSSWVGEYKSVLTYGVNEMLSNYQLLSYDEESGQLLNDLNIIYYYQPGSKRQVHQDWDLTSEIWVNSYQHYSSYIIEKIVDTTQNDYWNVELQQWVPYYKDITRYDQRINKVDRSVYNRINNQLEVLFKDYYYWSPFLPNTIKEKNINSLNVYPNPASTYVFIEIDENSIDQDYNSCIDIYNIHGQKITSLHLLNNLLHWDCSNEKPGIYFYSASINNVRYTGKIIIKR